MIDEPLKIILVEDNSADVRFIKELLKEDANIEIIDVNLLSKAIELINKKEYDLILLDLNLPDSRGINTFKEFSSKTKNIPIVILTVVDNKELAIEAIKLGAQDYKIKGSFDFISLRNSINYAIERKKLLTQSKISSTIFNNSMIGMLIVSPKHNILDANPAFCKILGYSLDELKKLMFNDFTHPDDLAQSIKLVKELASGKIDDFILEKKYIRKDGKIIYGRVKVNSVKDNKGNIIYNVVSMEDITESKKFQNYIIESEDKYKNFIEGTDSLVQSISSEGKILYVNPAWIKKLGYTSNDIKTINLMDIISPECIEHCMKLFKEVILGKKVHNIEAVFLKKDKTKVYVLGSAFPRITDGKVVATQGIFKDITELKQMEEQLKKSQYELIENEKLLSSTLNVVPVGIGRAINRKICWINEDFVKITGYSAKDIVGKSSKQLYVNIKEYKRVGKELYPQIWKHISNSIESLWKRKDGKIINVLLKAAMFDPYDRSKGVVFSILDITKSKKTEESLKESEEKYRLIYETSKDAFMAIAPPLWKFIYCNPSMISMFKAKNKEELLSKAPWNVSPKYQPDGQLSKVTAKKMIIQAMKTGSKVFDWYHMRLNGEIFPATVLLTKFNIKGKELLQATVRDITESKNAQDLILKEASISKEIIESVNSIVFSLDTNYCYLHFNERHAKVMKALYGANIEVGKSIFSYQSKRDAGLAKSNIDRALKGERVIEIDSSGIKPNERFFEVVHNPIRDYKGKVIGVSIFATDITERRKTEEEIKDLARFPEQNPNPILRVINNKVFYSNNTGIKLLNELKSGIKKALPKELGKVASDALKSGKKEELEVKVDSKVYWMLFVPFTKEGYVNIYALDITERKKTENKLMQSEEKYRNIIKNTNDIIISIDAKGVLTYVSPQADKYGIKPQELIGKNIFEIVYPQDVKRVMKDFKETMTTGREFPTVFRIMNHKGKIYWFEELGKLIKDNSGRILGSQGTLRDITDRKIAEDELKFISDVAFELNKSNSIEEVYEILIKTLSIIAPNAYFFISTYDKELNATRIIRLSGLEKYISKVTKLIGVNPLNISVKTSEMNKEELKIFTSPILIEVKKGFNSLSARKIPETVSKVLEKIIGIKKIYTVGFAAKSNILKGGVTFLVKDNSHLNNDLIENIINQAAISIDKHNSTLEIKKKEEQYSLLFDSVSDGVLFIDNKGVIRSINPKLLDIIGKNENEVLNKNFKELIPSFKIEAFDLFKSFVELIAGRKPESRELAITNANGAKIILQISASQVIKEGKILGLSVILRDITKEKEINKIKEFNDKILLKKIEEENMIKLKNQLLMRVSHELRHPLVPIVGYASVMLEENPSDIQEKYLQKILENSNYLKDLINKVLEVINFETGEARINATEFDINKLVEEVIFENETKAELKGLKIVKHLEKVGKVLLDKAKLKTAIGNLMDNAIKFTESGKVTLSMEKNNNKVIIGITDTGKGMTTEEIEKIFIYSQSENYNNLNMGLGLGLILSKYIIKAHNGELIISSMPNKGTIVKIILPKVMD